MRNKIRSVLLAVLVLASLAACTTQATPAATSGAPAAAIQKAQRVVFLIIQPLSPFETDIWDYVAKARNEGYASDIKLIEMKNPSEYEQTIRQVSEGGYDVVISTFFFIKDPFLKVAPDFPNTHYVMIYEPVPEPASDYPNIRGIVYDVQEGSYICGVITAHMSKTNRVGFIGGDDSPGIIKFLAGYEAGLKSVKPDIKLDITFAGSFIDPDKGHEMAVALYERGDDIVMHAANKTGLGLFVAATELGKYSIGVDIDQSNLAPSSVLCSALTNPGESVYRAIVDSATGKWSGGTVSWGIDDGVAAAAITGLVPEDVKKAALEAQDKIAKGTIIVPDTTATR